MGPSREPWINGGVALALLTAALYSISTAFYGGFMGVLRLNADVLDRNFHQTLYHGFLTAFVPTFYVLASICTLLMAYSHIGLPALNDALRVSLKRKRMAVKVKRVVLGKRRDSSFELRQKRRSLVFVAYVMAGVCFLFFLAHFEREGKEKANRLMDQLEKPISETSLVSVQIDGKAHRLMYLACGVRNCAGIDPTTRMTYYFPQSGYAFLHSIPALTSEPQSTTPD